MSRTIASSGQNEDGVSGEVKEKAGYASRAGEVEARVDADGVLLEAVKVGNLTIYPPRRSRYHEIKWVDLNGKRKQTSTGRTFAQASAAAETILDELEAGSELPGSLVSVMITNYLQPERVRGSGRVWSINTQTKTAWLLGKYVIPVIGHLRCRELTHKNLIKVITQTPAPSADTQKRLRGELRRLVDDGYELGYLNTPPAQLLRGLKKAGIGVAAVGKAQGESSVLKSVSKADLPSEEQIADLAWAMRDHWPDPDTGELFVYFAAYSGLRLGELLGLQASDFAADKQQVSVRRQALSSGTKIGLPKGNKTREAKYPKRTPTTDRYPDGYPLAEKIAQRVKALDGSALMFVSKRGSSWNHSNLYERAWAPAYADALWPVAPDGKNVFTFHILRHCAAVYWLWDRGVSARAVSDVLGHGSSQITLAIYGERGSRLSEFDE